MASTAKDATSRRCTKTYRHVNSPGHRSPMAIWPLTSTGHHVDIGQHPACTACAAVRLAQKCLPCQDNRHVHRRSPTMNIRSTYRCRSPMKIIIVRPPVRLPCWRYLLSVPDVPTRCTALYRRGRPAKTVMTTTKTKVPSSFRRYILAEQQPTINARSVVQDKR